MSVNAIADMLDDTLWGREFDRDEVEVISHYLFIHSYKKDEFIFREHDRQDYMAFITSGLVHIVKEREGERPKVISTLKARTHFGEMALIDNEPRSATAMAGQDVSLLVLTADNFEAVLREHPLLGIKILKKVARIISRRLRMTTGMLVSDSSLDYLC